MHCQLSRRSFLARTSVITAGLSFAGPLSLRAQGANEKVRIAVIGCNGRGMTHISAFLASPNAEIAYVCDVDSSVREKGVAAVAKKQGRKPKGVQDFRRALEDKEVDAVSIATPDHWHTPAAILACAAGKHVYLEKPGSHNAHESQLLVKAARKHKRVVQMGNQRRSWPWVIETIDAVHRGEIGEVYFARGWYTNRRATIGRGKQAPVPQGLDYSLWQGPAPEKPYHDNYLHYNWHWFWNWGTGEMGNNAVHFLDLARWGLQVDGPKRVTCGGNRYHFQDDWETPDIYVLTCDFGNKGITWEGQSCDPHGFEGATVGVSFYGENGCLTIAGNDAKIFDLKDKVVREIKGKHDEPLHFQNFLDGIREGKKLTSEIEEGQKATMLCHLGNIAWRSGHTVNFDSAKGELIGDEAAAKYWSRAYRKGWEPKV